MAPATQFKNWEAQARLLAAVLASLEGVRLDYKNIAAYIGSGVTTSAIEHRMRAVRVQAELVRGLVERGQDPGQYNVPACMTREEMHTLFGASTPEGLAFQFRAVKQGARVLQEAVAAGEDPVAAFSNMIGNGAGASNPGTPTARAPGSTKCARSTTKRAASGASTPGAKRRKMAKPAEEFADEDSPEADYDELDATPSKRPKHPAWDKPAPAPGQPIRRSKLMTAELKKLAAAGAAAGMTRATTPGTGTGTGTGTLSTPAMAFPPATQSPGMGPNSGPSYTNSLSSMSPVPYIDPTPTYQYPPVFAPYGDLMYTTSMLNSASPPGPSVSEANTPQTAYSPWSPTTTTTTTATTARTGHGLNSINAMNEASFKTESQATSFANQYAAAGTGYAGYGPDDGLYTTSHASYGGGGGSGDAYPQSDSPWDDLDAGDV
ncbi:hypothetical protein BT67DRAFT_431766 [Trichocladium antarcticum]|uniref:Uncharacterized protein n=1 Tax=Trichocladium antarcticum TaxID=1450529 RepID=A0AAN6ZGF3_9PEZI|nr:hypothetical protein BT67DRAFT_431766 [Trichocladium antarcticum]